MTLVRSGLETILISSGLQPGDRVCVSPVDTPVDGMAVRAAEGPGPRSFFDRRSVLS